MRIGIIGAGISGITCAHLLRKQHDIEILEAADYVGGHTNTIDVERSGGHWAVDTGFIVFNKQNYPNFIKLIESYGVAFQPGPMSFSVKCERTGLEYGFSSLNALFAQRRNLFSASFWRMLMDIRRFQKEYDRLLEDSRDEARTLAEYLKEAGYSPRFADHFLIPFGAAIWSADPDTFGTHPIRQFVQFFKNHGFLDPKTLLQWYVISGGSREYVKKVIKPFEDRIRLNTRVKRVRRTPDAIRVFMEDGSERTFDRVIFCNHSNEALESLENPTPDEERILGALPYQVNDIVLHTDARVLPQRRQTWASWNYCIPRQPHGRVTVTYDMNILQTLHAPCEFLVSLNPTDDIPADSIVERHVCYHPVYTSAGVEAREQHAVINGTDRLHYAGAYWGYGFHEDGVRSALAACEPFGVSL
jgi:predicted NAD/FAD-binding protein